MTSQMERSAAARGLLLESAASMLAQGSFAQASVAEIGARAGMSRGAVNYHFKTKSELLHELASRQLERCEVALEKLPRSRSVPDLVDVLTAFWHLDAEWSRITIALLYESLGPSKEIRDHVRGWHLRVRAHVARELDALKAAGAVVARVDPEVAALTIHAAVLGYVSQGKFEDAVDSARVRTEMIKHFEQYLRAV